MSTQPSNDGTFNVQDILHYRKTVDEKTQELVLLIHACDLYNNIAYNLAKLSIKLDQAEIIVMVAIRVLDELRVSAAKSKKGVPILRNTEFNKRLALYYDTLAWIYYRQRSQQDSANGAKECLRKAEKMLLDHALVYDSDLTIAHYHLSRVYVALVENEWQTINNSQERLDPAVYPLTSWLNRAFHHWSIAQRLDKNERLSSELRMLRDTLNRYLKYSEQILTQRTGSPEQHEEEGKALDTLEQILHAVKRNHRPPRSLRH